MKGYQTPPSPLDDSNASAHFKAGSALREFMAGRLGAPGCWPDENHLTTTFQRSLDELLSFQRWENDGGKTVVTPASAKAETFALQHFHPTRPLLSQLI